MSLIIWNERDNLFGIDYPTKKGKFEDYSFDIRYDYDGDPKIKPENCGLHLTILKNNAKVDYKFGDSISELVNYCEQYLQKEKNKFL